MRKLTTLVSLMAIVALLASVAYAVPATDSSEDPAIETADQMGGKDGIGESSRDKWGTKKSGAPAEKKDKPKYKPWGEVTKDAEKSEGLFTIFTNGEKAMWQINADQMDKPFINVMHLSKGIGARFVLGGLPISGTIMFDFHRVEDHIQVRQLNTLFRSGGDEAIADAIDLSYGNSILFSLPIVSENGDKGVLVDMNKVFLTDISDMGFWLTLTLQKPVRMDKKKAIYRSINVYPENVEVEALLTYSPGDRRGLFLPQVPDSRFIEIGVHYSINMLPEEPMTPRHGDDRVGYFMTPYKNFSNDADESFFVYNINRWRLEKKDPGAATSDPVEPIEFYLDTTIPQEYRGFVKQGIEIWQRAFEAAGFSNAIIAIEVPDSSDYNAEDARFNSIRWIVSDQPSFGAIGPSQVDPRTGEILNADILMEQNMIMSFRKTYRRYSGPEAFIQSDPMMKYLTDPSDDPEREAMDQLQRKFLGHTCDMMNGFMDNFAFGALAILAAGGYDGMEVPKEYIGEAIVFVTAHEVGHTIGLRHNFKSSTSTPYGDLNNKAVIDEIGMTGSVMDYPTPNVSRDRSKQGYYYTPTVGTYDQWAIRYGYTEFAGDKSAADEYTLVRKIADEASDTAHYYGTDEDTYPAGALDPYAMIWDLSDDPLAWAKERMGVCQDILNNGDLVERVVSEGNDYVALRNSVQTLLVQEYVSASRAVRFVGGQYTARPHRGTDNGDKPLVPVSSAKQREAMAFIASNGFSKDAFTVSPELLSMLQDDKLWTWQNNLFDWGRRFDFPLTGWVGGLQGATLAQLMNPMRLQRMVDTQYKQDDPFTIAEMLRSLTGTIWYDNMVPSGQTAVMQRNLQRTYVRMLTNMVVRPSPLAPQEAVSLARLNLTRINDRVARAYSQSGLSDEANAHLLETKARIDQALNAQMISGM